MPLTPLPSLSILNSTAHSLTLHLIPPDDFIPEDSPISYADPFQYQVSRSEEDDPDAIVVYEGTGLKVEVEGLKPVTNYRLKVRVRESEEFGGDWSSEFIECTGKTIDETLSQRLTSQLFRCIPSNDHETISKILSEHSKEISLETRDKHGKTLLMNACQTPTTNPLLITTLLSFGASPHSSTPSGKTPLSLTISHTNIPALKTLLSHPVAKSTINIPDQGGSTPLMWAVENANKKSRAPDGDTADGVEVVRLLVEAGADIDTPDSRGLTALDRLCATSGNVSAARILLDHGARIITTNNNNNNNTTTKHTMTTLMVAALNGHEELCQELMNRGCDPRIRTEFGGDAVGFARQGGFEGVVRVLEKGVGEWDKKEGKV